MKITEINFFTTKPEGDFIGFANIVIDNYLELNSLGIRIHSGVVDCTFPAKRLTSGVLKFHYFIKDPKIKDEIDQAIQEHLEEIGFFGGDKLIKNK